MKKVTKFQIPTKRVFSSVVLLKECQKNDRKGFAKPIMPTMSNRAKKNLPKLPVFRNFQATVYSPSQRLERNKSSVFVDGSSCGAAVGHKNFYSEVDYSNGK